MFRTAASRVVNSLLSPFGVVIVRKSRLSPDPWRRLELLTDVRCVIDVGVGEQGSGFLYSHFPKARYISIDPLEECEAVVRDRIPASAAGSAFHAVAVGAEDGVCTLNVANKLSRSSIMARAWSKDETFDTSERREVPLRRLDGLVSANDLEKSTLLKIDAEGYELEILKGATGLLPKVDYLLLEISTTQNYAESSSASEIFAMASANGFVHSFMCQAALVYMNMLFFKPTTAVARRIGVPMVQPDKLNVAEPS